MNWRAFITLLWGRKLTLIGAVVILLTVIAALFAPWLAVFDPLAIAPDQRLMEPAAPHWLGTDNFGRDQLARIIYGARMAVLIGIGVSATSIVLGTLAGMLSAYFPPLGLVVMRFIDVLMGFPALLLALAFAVILGPGLVNSIIAISSIYFTTTTRLVYGLSLRIREEVYIEAITALGASHLRIIFYHILPNLISPLIVQATFIFAFAQLQSAALDFLGLGLPPEVPSWGNMISESRLYIVRAPWLLIFPGLCIVLIVFSINLVGDLLRDRMDPRFRELFRK